MKKLQLKLLLEADEMLERNHLKVIFGGYDDGGYSGYGGTCGFLHPDGTVWYNISKADAKASAENTGGSWCCDSCASNGGSASYC